MLKAAIIVMVVMLIVLLGSDGALGVLEVMIVLAQLVVEQLIVLRVCRVRRLFCEHMPMILVVMTVSLSMTFLWLALGSGWYGCLSKVLVVVVIELANNV